MSPATDPDLPDDALFSLPSLKPSAWVGGLTLILMVALTVILRTKLPLIAIGEFRVVATMGSDPVLSPGAATLTKVSVYEGTVVQRGQVIVELRSDKIESLETDQHRLRSDIDEMKQTAVLLAEQRGVAAAGAGELDNAMQGRLAAARRKSNYADALARAGQKLAALGVGSGNDWLTARLQSAATAGELNDLRYAALDTQQALKLRVLDFDRQASELRMKIEERAANLNQVESAMASLAAANVHVISDAEHPGERRIQITAPYSGTVVELGQHRAGTLVEPGALLLRIARSESPLEAEMVFHDKQAARLAPQALVRVMYDAFPFTQYGARECRLRWVSPVADGGTVTARALVSEHRFDVEGTTRGAYPGMVGTVRAVVGERSLLDMILDPLRTSSVKFGLKS